MEINTLRPLQGQGKKLFVETYGCQMNVGDSEIVVSIMQSEGWRYTDDPREADVILINTCSIRDNAEQRIWGRLAELRGLRRRRQGVLIGIIGCMAERLKERLTEGEDAVDIVAGPDAYRDLPKLVREAGAGGKGINVLLSREETYAEIAPVRLDRNGVSAFVAIMRGCNNYCSYCVVPYVRGRERSRRMEDILREAQELKQSGVQEIMLLGQNVNSYGNGSENGDTFPGLLRELDRLDIPRIRFMTSHPKDLSDELIEVMAGGKHILHQLHLPAQSGNDEILRLMNRHYTREDYLRKVEKLRAAIPDIGLTTDLIVSFPGETEAQFEDTLSLVREVGYDSAFTFIYSPREGTRAAKMDGQIPAEESSRRIARLIQEVEASTARVHESMVGKNEEILVEGLSKRDEHQISGKGSRGITVTLDGSAADIGKILPVRITSAAVNTLRGERIERG